MKLWQQKPKKGVVIALITLIVLVLLAGGGVYYFMQAKDVASEQARQDKAQQDVVKAQLEKDKQTPEELRLIREIEGISAKFVSFDEASKAITVQRIDNNEVLSLAADDKTTVNQGVSLKPITLYDLKLDQRLEISYDIGYKVIYKIWTDDESKN